MKCSLYIVNAFIFNYSTWLIGRTFSNEVIPYLNKDYRTIPYQNKATDELFHWGVCLILPFINILFDFSSSPAR